MDKIYYITNEILKNFKDKENNFVHINIKIEVKELPKCGL